VLATWPVQWAALCQWLPCLPGISLLDGMTNIEKLWESYLKSTRASVVFAIQSWLGESSESRKSASQPAIFSVGMSGESMAYPVIKC
jgi:hypothetical protein